MPLEILKVHFDCAGSHKLVVLSGRFPRLHSRCGAVPIFRLGGYSSWQAQGNARVLVVRNLSWQVQEVGAVVHWCT